MQLKAGQVAVVTGAASGIGLALVEGLVDRGLDVVAADVEAAALELAVAGLQGRGGEVLPFVLDVRDVARTQAMADATFARFGRVDLLVNNAGVNVQRKYIWELEETDWRWVHEVNFYGVVNGLRAFVPHFVAQGHGHVVNVSSIAGMAVPGRGAAVYGASKHAVVGLTEGLRNELDSVAPKVITTVACPGRVATSIRDAAPNRPVDLAPSGTATTTITADPAVAVEPISAQESARIILAGIEAESFYLLVGPDTVERARSRAERILDSLPAEGL